MTRTVKVTNISTKATEKDLWDFFAFSGEIQTIQVEKVEETFTQVAFVTFVEEKALETALLLTGAVIVDRPVTVDPAPGYEAPPSAPTPSMAPASAPSSTPLVVGPADSISRAQDVMANLLAKGYILSKDTMANAKSLDEKHQLTKTASERAAALSESASTTAANLDRKIGLSQRFKEGATVVNDGIKSVDEKYGVVDKSRAAFAVAEQRVNEAASALMKNQYVASSATWLSGAFSRVAKVTEDISVKTKEKVAQQEAERGTPSQGEGRSPALSHPEFGLPSEPPAPAAPTPASTHATIADPSQPAVLQADSQPAKPAENLL